VDKRNASTNPGPVDALRLSTLHPINLTIMKSLPTPRQMKVLYISKTDIECEPANFHGNGIAVRLR
jgi:hypothetical protein